MKSPMQLQQMIDKQFDAQNVQDEALKNQFLD